MCSCAHTGGHVLGLVLWAGGLEGVGRVSPCQLQDTFFSEALLFFLALFPLEGNTVWASGELSKGS